MDFDDYQEEASRTAIYPQVYAVPYLTLGLAGEAGEVAELIKKMIRDDGGVLTPARREKLKKELGDVLWYVSELADWADLPLSQVATANLEKLAARKEQGKLNGDGSER